MKHKNPKTNLVAPDLVAELVNMFEFKSVKSFEGDDLDSLKKKSSDDQEFHKKLKAVFLKHKEAIDEIAKTILENKRYQFIRAPKVYIARTTDVKTGIEYFTAKTNWPTMDFKKKEVKIYLGKASEFDNDTKSKKAKAAALVKMKQTLARRVEAGEI
jgi:hypothetical protein